MRFIKERVLCTEGSCAGDLSRGNTKDGDLDFDEYLRHRAQSEANHIKSDRSEATSAIDSDEDSNGLQDAQPPEDLDTVHGEDSKDDQLDDLHDEQVEEDEEDEESLFENPGEEIDDDQRDGLQDEQWPSMLDMIEEEEDEEKDDLKLMKTHIPEQLVEESSNSTDALPTSPELSLQSLMPSLLVDIATTIEEALSRVGPIRIVVGSLCSGVFTAAPVLDAITACVKKMCGVDIVFELAFACELDDEKRDAIIYNFPQVKYVFKEALHMGRRQCFDHRSSMNVDVPKVDILIVGFVCTMMSSMSQKRRNNVGGTRKGKGPTGQPFKASILYAKTHKPALVIQENVLGLTQRIANKPAEIELCRKQWISAGYDFHWQIKNTQYYMLPQRRRFRV